MTMNESETTEINKKKVDNKEPTQEHTIKSFKTVLV